MPSRLCGPKSLTCANRGMCMPFEVKVADEDGNHAHCSGSGELPGSHTLWTQLVIQSE